LEKKPRDLDALNLLAEVARRAKRFDDAEKLLVQCVNISPDSVGFRFNYSVVLHHVHKYRLALEQMERALQIAPGNPLFRDLKAAILTRMGRVGEALVYRREFVEEFPAFP